MIAITLGIALVIMVFPVSPSFASAEEGPINVFLVFPQEEYEIGSEVEIVVMVFRDGAYHDPDNVTLEFGEDGRMIPLARTDTGRYMADATISLGDVSDVGNVHMKVEAATGTDPRFTSMDEDYIRLDHTFNLAIQVPDLHDIQPLLGQDIGFVVWTSFGIHPVDSDYVTAWVGDMWGEGWHIPLERAGTGEYWGNYTIPQDMSESAFLTIYASADYHDGDRQYHDSVAAIMQLDSFQVWSHPVALNETSTILELYVSNWEGSLVEGANVSVEYGYSSGFGRKEVSVGVRTDDEGRAMVHLNYPDIDDYMKFIDITGHVDLNGGRQGIRERIFVREPTPFQDTYPPTFHCKLVNETPLPSGVHATIGYLAQWGDEPLVNHELQVFLEDSSKVYWFGEITTDETGFFEVAIDTPEVDDCYSETIHAYFFTMVEDRWQRFFNTVSVGWRNLYEYLKDNPDPNITVTVEPFDVGGLVNVTIACNGSDGVDEASLIEWGIGPVERWWDDNYYVNLEPLVPAWSPCFSDEIARLTTVLCEWSEGTYRVSFRHPPFLPPELELFLRCAVSDQGSEESDQHNIIVEGIRPGAPGPKPEVSIDEIPDDVVCTGSLRVNGTTSGEDVERVDVSIDGGDWEEAEGTDEWESSVDTTELDGKEHVVAARSYDGHEYSEVTYEGFSIDLPPTVSIDSPIENERCSGTITISGTADDDISLDNVEFRIDDGDWLAPDGLDEWTYELDTTTLLSGNHRIEARSHDGFAFSVPMVVEFIVDQPPTVAINCPWEGATFTRRIDIEGVASDDMGIECVKLRIDDGPWFDANGTAVWTASIRARDLGIGDHTLEARSFDGLLASPVANVTFRIVEPPKERGIPGLGSISTTLGFLVCAIIIVNQRRKKGRFPGRSP